MFFACSEVDLQVCHQLINILFFRLGCSPVIVKHPESRNVALGEKEVTFKCEADGTRPLEYSWKFNGQLMATDKTLTLNNIDRNQEGKYYCHVKNNYDSTTSSAELIIGKCTNLYISSVLIGLHMEQRCMG